MNTDIVEIADLDCIYLSYDEPQKEEFWVKIKNMIPWARRVDKVKGSDADGVTILDHLQSILECFLVVPLSTLRS